MASQMLKLNKNDTEERIKLIKQTKREIKKIKKSNPKLKVKLFPF